MQKTFNLALLGEGEVSPHALRGALIVLDNEIIGEAAYKKYGSLEAEVIAVDNARKIKSDLSYAILYCNIEPTLKAAEFIVENRIRNVVIGCLEPINASIEFLQSNDVNVITGVLEKEAVLLNEIYFYFCSHQRPLVHTISNENDLALLANKYDCIVVDQLYIEQIDPDFIFPSTIQSTPPLRIVISRLSKLNFNWRVLSDKYRRNTMIVTSDADIKENPLIVQQLEAQGVALLSARTGHEGQIDFNSVLKSLASLKFTSLLQVCKEVCGPGHKPGPRILS